MSGRDALARVGLAGSFFECFAGCLGSGRFAMRVIWVESAGEESTLALFQLDPGALNHLAPFLGIRGHQRAELLGAAAGDIVAQWRQV